MALPDTIMPTRVAFIACETTLPDMPHRRADAHEFDQQFGALEVAFAAREVELVAVDWKSRPSAFEGMGAAVIGTPWNYQDQSAAFIERLDEIEASMPLFNPAALVAWNLRKTYLRELGAAGARTVVTHWEDEPRAEHVRSLWDAANCEAVVVKRQVGAGASDQRLFRRGDTLPEGPLIEHPAMLQPFMPAIQSEGEYSLIFIDGQFCHALLKTARAGDYRIQSIYGGAEASVAPSPADIRVAREVLDCVPFEMPLYARIDMVRDAEGRLCLMEAEMIEPYLYPLQGPAMAALYAEALLRRLHPRRGR